MKNSQNEWETRAATHGNTPRAVLLKGLPDSVNALIDQWHRTVLRKAFHDVTSSEKPVLDIGCGYGRLAREVASMKLGRVVGIDYTPDFCRLFRSKYGDAVCGNLASLPFADATFSHAYAVTALMYLDVQQARDALVSLDRCVANGARILLLEPGAEFNRSARLLLRRKRNEPLARPGFTRSEFDDEIVPPGWRRLASGSNAWTTALLPMLILSNRFERISRGIGTLCAHLDRPRSGDQWKVLGRYALHRWAIYEVP